MEADINGTHTVLYTNDPVPAGRHHLVGTYDGSVMRLYLDGVEAAAPLFVTGTLGNRGEPLEIGRYSPNLALCKFVGTVDEVAVYDRALTTTRSARKSRTASSSGRPPPPTSNATSTAPPPPGP
jgi:hypothetical protein